MSVIHLLYEKSSHLFISFVLYFVDLFLSCLCDNQSQHLVFLTFPYRSLPTCTYPKWSNYYREYHSPSPVFHLPFSNLVLLWSHALSFISLVTYHISINTFIFCWHQWNILYTNLTNNLHWSHNLNSSTSYFSKHITGEENYIMIIHKG